MLTVQKVRTGETLCKAVEFFADVLRAAAAAQGVQSPCRLRAATSSTNSTNVSASSAFACADLDSVRAFAPSPALTARGSFVRGSTTEEELERRIAAYRIPDAKQKQPS